MGLSGISLWYRSVAVLDMQSGGAVGVPEYRYESGVSVIEITGSPRWTDILPRKGLGLVVQEPSNTTSTPKRLVKHIEPGSVIDEYGSITR